MTEASKMNVLFVDDSPMDADLYTDYFDQDSIIQPTTALSAGDGFSILSQSDIDCVVSDGVRTNDGELLVTVVKETHPDVPVLLYSGQSPDQLPTEVVDGFVQKGARTESPPALEALGERIRTLARRKDQSTASTRTGSGQRWRSLGTFDWTTTDSAATVIEGLAEQTGSADLGPLYDHVDPGAVMRLMTHSVRKESTVDVQFDISGYTVRMSSNGVVKYREDTS
jgi:DNA-binding NtrC family response regulator